MATDKEKPIYHIDLNADGEENIPAAPEAVEPAVEEPALAPVVEEPAPAPSAPTPAPSEPVAAEPAPVVEEPAPAVEEPAPAPVAPRVETVETVENVETIEHVAASAPEPPAPEPPVSASEPPTPAASTAPATPSAPPTRPISQTHPIPPQQKRRSNVGLWITIAVLAAIIAGGATWYVITYVLNDKDKKELVDDEDSKDEATAQVISYETDDTPNYPNDEEMDNMPIDEYIDEPQGAPDEPVTNKSNAERQHNTTDNATADQQSSDASSSSSSTPAEQMTGYVFSGTITNTDGSTSNIVIESNISNYGSVNGISEHASRNYNIYGHYIKEINRLVINEQSGGKFEGQLSGSQYTGKYRDAEGTTHNFSFRVRIHRLN